MAAAIAVRMKSVLRTASLVDFETLDDNAVTIRDRDTMEQERISIDQVEAWLAPKLLGC